MRRGAFKVALPRRLFEVSGLAIVWSNAPGGLQKEVVWIALFEVSRQIPGRELDRTRPLKQGVEMDGCEQPRYKGGWQRKIQSFHIQEMMADAKSFLLVRISLRAVRLSVILMPSFSLFTQYFQVVILSRHVY